VTALCPGPVETRFAATAGFGEDEAGSALPKVMWVPATEVAAAAVRGMDANRAVVIPGAANRITAVVAGISPRSVIVPIVARSHPGLRPR